MAQTYYCDPADGIDGTGTFGVDWVNNPGTDPLKPRRTVDCATWFQAGNHILVKRGTVYPLTGTIIRNSGAAVTAPNNGGMLLEIGTASTLKKDRIYFGAYGEGKRPVLDGLGLRTTGISLCANITVEDLEIKNCLAHGITASGATNATIRRCIIGRTLNNVNDSDGVYIRSTGLTIELNIFERIGGDCMLSDLASNNVTIRRNIAASIGSDSLDGSDGFVFDALGTGVVIEDNYFGKVSRQKQGGFLRWRNTDAAVAVAPVIRRNAMVGPCEGSGLLTFISTTASTVHGNYFIGPRHIGMDRNSGAERYAEGVSAYGNVFIGLPHILRPDLTGAAEVDADGYPDTQVFVGSSNASAHVASKFVNNFVYNFRTLIGTGNTTGVTEAHNNVLVRSKIQALPSSDNTANSGNALFDEGTPGTGVHAGSPVANLYHNSSASGKPTRIPGYYPALDANFGVTLNTPCYYAGDGTKLAGTDLLGASWVTENAGAGMQTGPVQGA